jgi:hypothetical protein
MAQNERLPAETRFIRAHPLHQWFFPVLMQYAG